VENSDSPDAAKTTSQQEMPGINGIPGKAKRSKWYRSQLMCL
jgi:hypothetical protein